MGHTPPVVKRLAVLGSTGSIGRQTLDVVRARPDLFSVVGLAGGSNLPLLAQQANEFGPTEISTSAPHAEHLGALRRPARQVSLSEMACSPDVDLVVVATAGRAGLLPTLAALQAGKQIALANKEALVVAGELVMAAAKAAGVQIRPIDSEHSALWQCLWGEDRSRVSRLLLTASGGAFRDLPVEELAAVTPERALKHPTWLMGPKVTVDSATLMNKGLEVMEAHWLFGADYDQIEVVLHRESIVHSMVEFVDGSIKAQLGVPDMRLPIMCALGYPERLQSPFGRLDVCALGSLSFGPVDLKRYPCLSLALQAGRAGGTYPAVLSAADEIAVEAFLSGRIGFTAIASIVSEIMERHVSLPADSLQAILSADTWARALALEVARRLPTP